MDFKEFSKAYSSAKQLPEKMELIVSAIQKLKNDSESVEEILALHSIVEFLREKNGKVSDERATISALMKEIQLYQVLRDKEKLKNALQKVEKYILFINEQELLEIKNILLEQASEEMKHLSEDNMVEKDPLENEEVRKLISLIISDVFLKNQAHVLSGDLISFLMKEKAKSAALGYNANFLSNIVSIVEINFESIIKPYQEELKRLQ